MVRSIWSFVPVMLLSMAAYGARIKVSNALEGTDDNGIAEEVDADSAIIVVVAAQAGVRRANARAAAAANARLKQQRLDRERHEAQMRAEKERKHQQHVAANKQDCEVEERWSQWSQCSAECGGGIRTQLLEFRTVKVVNIKGKDVQLTQDRHGYGKPCPKMCDEKSDAACGEKRFEICADQHCPTDCSYVDLGSRLSGPGTPADWNFQTIDGSDGKCVLQFWQTLAGSRLQLLGETTRIEEGGPGEMFRFTSSSEPQVLMLHSSGGGVDYNNVRLGFRGCNLKRKDGQAATEVVDDSIARVCLYGDAAFGKDRQKVDLDRAQKKYLDWARRQSRKEWAVELANAAAVEGGVGEGDAVHIGKSAADDPQFELSVTMSPKPPFKPTVKAVNELDDALQLDLRSSNLDNGAPLSGYSIQVRKIFDDYEGGRCTFVELPLCAGAGNQPCKDSDFVLRNLPFATKFEVRIRFQNEAGYSRGAYTRINTRAASGVPLNDCYVTQWECGDGEATWNEYPEADSEECKLTTIGLPICFMKPRQTFFKKSKCDGKKYWEECVPVMKRSSSKPECAQTNGKFPHQVCTHISEEMKVADKAGESKYTPQLCVLPGCSTSAFGWLGTNKHCCCKPGTESSQDEDSPYCACEKQQCDALGLVEASDASASCRH